MSIAKASDIIALLDNLDYRALTFRAELFPLVGDSPFFIAPPISISFPRSALVVIHKSGQARNPRHFGMDAEIQATEGNWPVT